MKFYESLERFADSCVVIDSKGCRYTYGQLVQQSDKFASCLDQTRKNLIFILCSNNIASITGYLGTLRSGNTGVLLAANTDWELVSNLIKLYRPDYVWRSGEESDRAIYEYEDYRLIQRTVERKITINRELALLLPTSGSTGSPKMVRLTGNNVDANASSIAQYLKLDHTDRPITSMPMHYSYGLSIINSHLKVGATILLTDDSFITRPFWDFFKEYAATSFAGVPYIYETLRRLKFFDMSLPSLKTMTQAGGKLTPEFVLEFVEFSRKKGIDFYVMYGQTEATARISYLPPKDNLSKYKSMGIAIPGGELSLIDDDGKTITRSGVDGELVYRGPNVMLGYAEKEEDLAKGDDMHGELKTGDVAQFDEDGYFYITGRMKRFIKIYGERVNLDAVEHYLKSLGYVCVCGGKDDLLCVATTDSGKTQEIKNTILSKFGYHHNAVRVIEVKDIIKSSSGKILYEQMFQGIL